MFAYDDAGSLLARTSRGQGVDQPLAVERGGQSYYYQADHQGSVRALTDVGGAVANSYAYDAYGNFEAATETITQLYAYTGREFDAESSLHYYRARYYDSLAGRFLGEDPIGFAAGDANLYRYVFNNPVNLIDPDGKDTTTFGGTVRVPKTIVRFFFPNFEGQGISAGLAISEPDSAGAELDIGLFLTLSGGGSDVGLGRATIDLGKRRCSVRDLRGRGAKINVQVLDAGGTLMLDESNNIVGLEANLGPGLSAGGAGTITKVFSLRERLEKIFQ